MVDEREIGDINVGARKRSGRAPHFLNGLLRLNVRQDMVFEQIIEGRKVLDLFGEDLPYIGELIYDGIVGGGSEGRAEGGEEADEGGVGRGEDGDGGVGDGDVGDGEGGGGEERGEYGVRAPGGELGG